MIDREQSRSVTSRREALVALAALLVLTFAAQTSSAQTYTILYVFQGQADGGFPQGGLYRDASGNLYGINNTAGNRNDCNDYGCGTVYKLDTSGSLTVLHTFTGGADGWPGGTWGSLIPDPAGNLYGVASTGGIHDNGTVFRIAPSGQGFTVMHTFPSLTTVWAPNIPCTAIRPLALFTAQRLVGAPTALTVTARCSS